jgi:lactate permease
VAFGSLGIPIITLAKISGLPEMLLSQLAGRQLTLFSLIIPAWLVVMMSGWKGLRGCWPAVVVCGGSYAGVQFAVSNYLGPALVNVLGGLASIVAMVVWLRFWQPRQVWRFPGEAASGRQPTPDPLARRPACVPRLGTSSAETPESTEAKQWHTPEPPITIRQVLYAWMPWLLLTLMVFLWGWPAWNTILNGGPADRPNVLSRISVRPQSVPDLNGVVFRTSPVVPVPPGSDRAAEAEAAVYEFNWLSATGSGLFLAAVLTACWLRIGPRAFLAQFAATFWRVRWALATIACMLALAFVTKYSGADATLGLALTHTGRLYPFFAPLLGWLGVALTGSDTSANALFGSLQRITAEQLGLNTTLIVASNSTGGVMGKMIAAPSIVVAAAATGQSGGEGRILRFVFLHSLVLAALMGLVTLAQAYLVPWTIP